MDAPLVARAVSHGAFTCPACEKVGAYALVRVTRDDAEVGAYVECTECFCTFPRSVLWRADDEPVRPNHLEACLRTMVLMMVADDKVVDEEIERITTIYPHVGGRDLTAEDVMAEVARIQEDDQGLEPFLQRMAVRLNEQGKLAVIRGAYEVATADGFLHEAERELLADLARALHVANPLDKSGRIR